MREAYLQFMVSVASMLRADMNLPENSYLVREDMVQVLELETQLANVRPRPGARGGGWARLARPSVTTCPVQATAPQEERHDVTTLYHRMSLEDLQNKFGLKVSSRPPRPPSAKPQKDPAGTHARLTLTPGQPVAAGLSRATGPRL